MKFTSWGLQPVRVIIFCILCGFSAVLPGAIYGQVKISDSNDSTLNPNAILELQSGSKGFLPPRLTLTSLSSPLPLTAPVSPGMLVYDSSGTNVDKGFYYWTGSDWERLAETGAIDIFPTQASTSRSLLIDESFIVATAGSAQSYRLNLTLPAVTTADDGKTLFVKNAGVYQDFILVYGPGSSAIEDRDYVLLTAGMVEQFVVESGRWLYLHTGPATGDIFYIGPNGSWDHPSKFIETIDLHATLFPEGVAASIAPGNYAFSSTLTVDLSIPLSLSGSGTAVTKFTAASGLANNPMIEAISELDLSGIAFDGSTLSGYGNNTGETALFLNGTSQTAHRFKNIRLHRFNRGILVPKNHQVDITDAIITNSVRAGVEVSDNSAAGGAKIQIQNVTFENNLNAIYLNDGTTASVIISGCTFNLSTGQTGIRRTEADFVSVSLLHILSNSWNNAGTFYNGFDFTRTDGRDANVMIVGNAGIPDAKPRAMLNVTANTTNTAIGTANNWYKVALTTTSPVFTYQTVKWTVNGNRITFQSDHQGPVVMYVSGTVSNSANNRNMRVAIVQNGASGTRYGEQGFRFVNTYANFSTVVFFETIQKNDFFELFITAANTGNLRVSDLSWYTIAE